MEKYLNKLIEQFASARGIKHIDVNSKNFINEFCQWIKENKHLSGGTNKSCPTFVYYVDFLEI